MLCMSRFGLPSSGLYNKSVNVRGVNVRVRERRHRIQDLNVYYDHKDLCW